jgi:hypothetical protein
MLWRPCTWGDTYSLEAARERDDGERCQREKESDPLRPGRHYGDPPPPGGVSLK